MTGRNRQNGQTSEWIKIRRMATRTQAEWQKQHAATALDAKAKRHAVTGLREQLDAELPTGSPWFAGLDGGFFVVSPCGTSDLARGLHRETGMRTETREG